MNLSKRISNTAESTDRTVTLELPKAKPRSNLSNIERALQDIKGDIEKWERIYKQLISIDGIDVMVYQTHEKITELESLQFILKSQLSKMGGK